MRIARTLVLLLAACCGHAAASTVVWDNAAGNGVWDVGKTANWNTGGSTLEATVFQQYDYAEFSGNGAGEIVLSPAGDVKDIHAYDITVYGSGDYTFSAAYDFANLHIHGNLNKGGSGTLTIQTPNTHVEGTVNLGGGTLEVADYVAGFSGQNIQFTDSATLLVHGRTLGSISVDERAEAQIDAATVGSISGQGTLVKVSDGTLTLAESNSVSHITLQQGTLVAGNDKVFAANNNDLKLEGGTLDLGGFSCASRVELAGDNTASILNGALTNKIEGNGGFTKEGNETLTIGYFDGTNTYNSYHGDTVVNGGTLRAAADNAFGDYDGGDIIMNAGTLDLAGHRANNTMQAWGDSTLLSNGGRLKSVLVNTHALTVEGKLETGSLDIQGGGDLKLLKGGSISLGSEVVDEEPVWEKKASLAVLGEAGQATLHNVQIQGYSWFMGESAERSRIDDIDFTAAQDIGFRYLTIGADNSFTTTAKNGTITLWNDVTIDLSDATYQLLADVYYFDLTGMFHCDLLLGDVYLDATDLEFNLQDAAVQLDFGDQVNILPVDSVRLGMKGYDTELKLAAGGKLEFHATAQTPEPATGTLGLLALAALSMRRRRR
ncbi:MAG: autotransporter-associated beta strand repeat-containing protein [Akkermansia sp.]|nr:autotransporter-associated beta strand repeat-containing protein [Akkermansia sp.]